MHLGKKQVCIIGKRKKSYEGIKFEFSNDYQAAILTGSEFFLIRCRGINDYVHVCVIAALYMHKQCTKLCFVKKQ